MISDVKGLTNALARVYVNEQPPRPLHLLLALRELEAGVPPPDVAKKYATNQATLRRLVGEGFAKMFLDGRIPPLTEERSKKVRSMLGQLLLGNIAERVFEDTYKATVGTSELRLEDDRSSRTDTDYRVLNGQQRPVFRLNIKYHGSLFQKAWEMVGLESEDCFALATYKIQAALEKQDKEHLAYIFVIVGVPGLTGATVGADIPEDLVHLSAISFESTRITGKRAIEDRIVHAISENPTQFGFERAFATHLNRIRRAPWYALSARKAKTLLKDHLFERVFALRVRGFARYYRNAELDMHFSLSKDLTPLEEFLKVLRDHGLQGLAIRLERGTI